MLELRPEANLLQIERDKTKKEKLIFKQQEQEQREKVNLLKKVESEKEEEFVISKLNEGFSIRQIWLQFDIDKRRIRKIINEQQYSYGTRRRMFAVDPKSDG